MTNLRNDFMENLLFDFQNKDELKKIAFEQYKVIVDSVKSLNETREHSNTFWVSLNTVGISAVSYLHSVPRLSHQQKPILLWTFIVFGIALCISWIRYLITIKQEIQAKKKFLIEIERILPIPVFTNTYPCKKSSVQAFLTNREIAVPVLFLLAYIFFGVLLLYFPGYVMELIDTPH